MSPSLTPSAEDSASKASKKNDAQVLSHGGFMQLKRAGKENCPSCNTPFEEGDLIRRTSKRAYHDRCLKYID